MANTVTSQTLVDGKRNLVMLFTGVLDTSDEARVIKVDVSSFNTPATKVRVDSICCHTSGALKVILDWDASTPVRFAALFGNVEIEEMDEFGGIINNAGAGVTGDIFLTTVGWSAGSQTYTLLLCMTKESF
jgi:hypothetical protein